MARIWTQDKKRVWLYVEQAAAGNLNKPYRQRVYELKQLEDNLFASVVYALEDLLKYAGDYQQESPLADLSENQLKERVGCTVYLKWVEADKAFVGKTKEKECLSQLRGATYATSEVTVTETSILSWDRGWDANDQHVWGAEKSGYIFLKQEQKAKG